jgi:hypothetical protein
VVFGSRHEASKAPGPYDGNKADADHDANPKGAQPAVLRPVAFKGPVIAANSIMRWRQYDAEVG